VLSIRLARPSDSIEIARLLRSGFERRVRSLTPYGCRGAGRYVREQLGRASPWVEGAYAVATRHRKVVGCCEIRRSSRGALLNYIAVRPQARRSGVGTSLLRGALTALAARGGMGSTFELDVFSHNAGAIRWYQALGLRETGRFAWHTLGRLPKGLAGVGLEDLRLRGIAQAEVTQAAFGFSEFRVERGDRGYTVGRLGTRWYRLTDRAAAEDGDLLALLARLAPRRGVLLVARPPTPRVRWPMLVEGSRMEAPLSLVMERLNGRASQR
jgi:ribosomal protein S18 acetylase RimI-like enzyme